eukprot:6043989-Heterocapsa_arctica.AAC.1
MPGEAQEEQQPIDVKVEDEDQKEEDDGVVVEWRPGQQPTKAQREAHAATHIPYAPWCGVCIEGQGRDESHRRQLAVEGPPVVELDYSFLKTAEPDDVLSTVLLGYLKRKGYGYAAK